LLLSVKDLVTGYGRKTILDRVSLSVSPGEIVAIIGHNGAGKSTLLKAILRAVPVWSGDIQINGVPLFEIKRSELVRAGIAYAPQRDRVFGRLTVAENLEIAATSLNRNISESRRHAALSSFPELQQKLRLPASLLSGGESQMLALANALVPLPKILLLDEPSLGLSPPAASRVLQRVQQVSSEAGVAALIVEHKVRQVLSIARRVCVLKRGKVSYFGPTEPLSDGEALRSIFL
jgi:branched-chain amino acid transport system ATP-binding protein